MRLGKIRVREQESIYRKCVIVALTEGWRIYLSLAVALSDEQRQRARLTLQQGCSGDFAFESGIIYGA